MKKVIVVIPALNPDDNLKTYISDLLSDSLIAGCIVVDDGSEAPYRKLFQELESLENCTVLCHPVNRGKGAGLKTAFSFYLQQHLNEKTAGIVTADADGQHKKEDVHRIAQKLCEACLPDVADRPQPHHTALQEILILGVRDFSLPDIPKRSRFGNRLTEKLFYLLYHVRISDTQTGLRGISAPLVSRLLSLKGDRYEYEMNMLSYCALNKIPISCIPIRTVYEDGNASSHFHPVLDSIRIYRILFGTFLRFAVSSLASSLVDLTAFQILVLALRRILPDSYIIAATVLARIISGIFNFIVNKRLVFQSGGHVLQTVVKYVCLWLAQMLISAYGVQGLFHLTHLPELLIKVIVDTLLFFISYRIQKNLIFKSAD